MEKQKILNKVDELIELLKSSEDYQRYIYLSNEMKKNNTLMSIINEIKKLEQKRVNLDYKKEDTKEIDIEIESKKNELNEYPIYVEYNYLKEDLDNAFQSIKSILENNINE